MEVDGEVAPLNFHVVGVGASAGGISALTSLVGALPEDAAFAMVIVQHLHPDYESQLTHILSRATTLKVLEAANDIAVESGCIYIIGPGQVLTLERGRLKTHPANGGSGRISSIDAFFESLAAEQGEKAIALLLSGTGSDGAAGAMQIKHAGGVVLVQDPASALYNGMPLSAIGAGAADYVLPLDSIAQLLPTSERPYLNARSAEDWSASAGSFAKIMALIRDRAGLDLEGYKHTPLLACIHSAMQLRRLSLKDYADFLEHEPLELMALHKKMLVNVTSFFRDPDAWRQFEMDALSGLFVDRAHDGPIRAWTAACSSGEEAYSLAMILSEHCDPAGGGAAFQLFATDASANMIDQARAGFFAADRVAHLSADRIDRFFDRIDGGYRIKKALRNKIVFATQNLLADPPFPHLDLVTCRNLLIYLDWRARERVLALLNASLRMGGYLFLGSAESILREDDGFEPLSNQFRIYRKIASPNRKGSAFPLLRNVSLRRARQGSSAVEELGSAQEELEALNEELNAVNAELSSVNAELGEANAKLREKIEEIETQQNVLASGAVITLFLDQELRIRWFTPAVRDLFPLQASDIGRQITDFAPRFTDPDLAETLRSVLATEEPHESEEQNTEGRWYLRHIRPYRIGRGRATGLAVTFADITAMKQAEAALAADLAGMSRLHELHSSLSSETDLRKALGFIVVASNDFLGADRGCIQLVSDDGERLEMFAHSGYGPDSRFIAHFLHQGSKPACDMARQHHKRLIIENVETFSPLQGTKDREVALSENILATQSTPMITRTGEMVGVLSNQFRQPHRPSDNELRLVDLLAWTAAHFVERHRGQTALRESEERFRALTTASSYVVYRMSPDWREMRALDGQGFLSNTSAPTQSWLVEYILPEDQRFVLDSIEEAIRNKAVFDLTHRVRRADGGVGWTHSRAVPLLHADGSLREWFGAATDISCEKQAEEALRESEEKHRTLFQTMGQGYCDLQLLRDPSGRAIDQLYLELNPAFERVFGIPAAEAKGRRASQVFPKLESWWHEAFDRIAKQGAPDRLEYSVGSLGRWFEVLVYPRGGDRLTVLYEDITERKRAENALREAEERQGFLLRLSDALRPLTDPEDIKANASRLLGEHLGVDRAAFAELTADGEHMVTADGYLGAGVSSVAGTHHSVEFGAFFSGLQEGQVVTIDDVMADPMPESCRNAWAILGIRAAAAFPVMKQGHLAAALYVNSIAPRHWSKSETALIAKVGDRTWDAVERARAEARLRESEERYRSLFDAIDEGFCIIEMLFDEGGKPLDYRFLEVNPAFVAQTGLTNAQGRTMLELAPRHERHWFEIYGQIALTGEAARFESEARELGRWYDVHASRYGPAERRQVAILFKDITSRKQAEETLRRTEKRQAFLLKLSDALRPLGDPVSIQETATRVLGEHLGVSQTYYVELDEARQVAIVERDYTRGETPSLVGEHPMAPFAAVLERTRTGLPFIAEDAETMPEIQADLPAYRAVGHRAFVTMPLIKEGVQVAAMCIVNATPRKWSQEEIAFLSETSERTWAALELQKAQLALQYSEKRLRRVLDTDAVGLLFFDREGVLIDANNAFLKMTGYPRTDVASKALTWRTMTPPEWVATSEEQLAILAATGRIGPYEKEYFRANGSRSWMLFAGRDLGDGTVVEFAIDISDRKRAEEHLEVLLREVNHRSKNMLALIQAVARQTAAASPTEFLNRFSERIQALAAAQDLLVRTKWQGVDCADLVRSQLAHFQDLIGTRIECEGPPLLLSAAAAQRLGMAIHELATNAGKYGSLSNGVGCVKIAWSLETAGDAIETFSLSWDERGGPPAAAPSSQGFGSTVTGRLAESGLDASVDRQFLDTGLSWRLRCPAAGILEG
jgi:PAS domain S-box-containing protein